MASAFMLDAPARPTRAKKIAKPVGVRISPAAVVERMYRDFPDDMARLAE